MYPSTMAMLLLLTCAIGLTYTVQAQSSPAPSTGTITPGKSIHLPSNGVGTWREISLSRRSNSQTWDNDSKNPGSSSSAPWIIQHSCNAVWIFIFYFSLTLRIM